jgi:hypothetical protein
MEILNCQLYTKSPLNYQHFLCRPNWPPLVKMWRKPQLRTWIPNFEPLRSPRIDSKEPIPPDCVAWWAGTTTLFLLGSFPIHILQKFQHISHTLWPAVSGLWGMHTSFGSWGGGGGGFGAKKYDSENMHRLASSISSLYDCASRRKNRSAPLKMSSLPFFPGIQTRQEAGHGVLY